MAKLTTKQRNALPASDFVFPKERKFPIEDASHARDAESRAAAKGGSVEKKVRAAVHRNFPAIGNRERAAMPKVKRVIGSEEGKRNRAFYGET